MALIVAPSRNPMLNSAWKAHKAAQRAEKKPKEEPAPDVHKNPAKAPAAKKAKRGGRK